MARLRRGAAAGDMAAVRDLGHTLLDGIQDRQGHSLVRRNSRYAVRLLQLAAESGDSAAAAMLAYAYDVGKGVDRDGDLAIKWNRRAIKQGELIAPANLATIYRDQGNLRLAHYWYLRAKKMGDDDAAVDAGYGYLYGIGVRRNVRTARRLMRFAVQSNYVTQYSREEALYHLAVAEVDSGSPIRAIPFLVKANKDGDYPEAASLLARIRAKTELRPCRCRRYLYKYLPGHAKCPVHPTNDRSAAGKRTIWDCPCSWPPQWQPEARRNPILKPS